MTGFPILEMHPVASPELLEKLDGRKPRFAQMIFKRSEDRIGQIANADVALDVFFLPHPNRPQRQHSLKLFEGPVDDLFLKVLPRHGLDRLGGIVIEERVAFIPNVLLPDFFHLVSDLPADDFQRGVVHHEELAAEIGERLDINPAALQSHPMLPPVQLLAVNPGQESPPQTVILAQPADDLHPGFQDAPDVVLATHSPVYNYGSVAPLQEPVVEVLENHDVGGCPGIGSHQDGKAAALRHSQSDLEELSDLTVFASPRSLGQAPAFKIGIRDVDDRRMVSGFVSPQTLQNPLFHLAEIPSAEMPQGVIQPAGRNLLKSQKLGDLGVAEPFLQLPDTRPFQKMGIDKRQDVGAVFAEHVPETQLFGHPVDGQNIGAMADGLDLDVGGHYPSLDLTIDLFSDVAEDFLDDLALDAVVFDLGQVDIRTLFNFSDEAHGVYNIHHGYP